MAICCQLVWPYAKYGHTQIPYNQVTQHGILPINLYQFSDGVYIEGATSTYKNVLGAKVLKVGSTPIKRALELIYPVVPAENEQYVKAYGIRFLISPEVLHAQGIIPELSNSVSLTLEKAGKQFVQEFAVIPRAEKPRNFNFTLPTGQWITARDTSYTPYYLKHLAERYYYFEYLEDSKALYVRQSSVFNQDTETLEEFYKRLFEFIDTHEVSKLIYDVRLNGGGNSYNNLPLIKGIMARPNINTKGKLFFIIGRDTYSACQNLINDVHRYTEAVLVGEPTSENEFFYGDAKPIRLKHSNITAYLSFAWWQNGPEWEGKDATYPNLAVEMTFEDYKSNNDVVLQTALEFKDDGLILDPLQHLTDLFIAGNYEQLKIDAAKIARDSRYRFYDFKGEFSKAGGRLYAQGNPQAALFIYQIIVEYYTNDIGSWYNIANLQKELKQTEEAISSYKKVIQLDATHPLAQSAKKSINELQN